MDSDQFDALIRKLSTRRTALAGGIAGLAAILGLTRSEAASAHDPAAACRKLADPVKRRRCLNRARAHHRKQHSCQPQPVAVTCAGQCGTKLNNCRKPVTCTCSSGKACLPNGTCSRPCHPIQLPCPGNCFCARGPVENEDPGQCIPDGGLCEQSPLVCTSTAECPVGHYCSPRICTGPSGLESRCVPICQL